MKRILKYFLGSGFICLSLLSAGCGDNSNDGNEVPSAPTNVAAVSNINKVTLDWNSVPGAASYNVYWSTNPGVTTATGNRVNVTTNHFQHIGLFVSQTYFYIVTAVADSGESAASSQAATVVATDGANLYVTHCQGCHGPVTATTIMVGTDVNIRAAIAGNRGGMGVLSRLTDSQILVISQQLPCH